MNIMNATSNIAQNNDINYFLRLLCAITAGMISLVNLTYIIVCFKVLRKSFHHLVILGLCCSDRVTGLSSIIFVSLPLLEISNGLKETCILQLFTMTFGISLNYCFIFLMCLQRYMTVRSYNFGTVEQFDRKKYFIVSGLVILVFFIVFGSMILTPKEDQFTECTVPNLYGNRYVIYVCAGVGPPILIIFLVILISFLTSFHLWKTYFKIRKIQPMSDTLARRKNTCNMQSKRFELDQHLAMRTTSHFINSELSTQERIEDSDGSSDDEDNRTSHIKRQDFNTKIMQTEDCTETSIEILFVSDEDKRFELGDRSCKITQIGNTNISTQIDAGIFVPIINDFQRCTLATGESSTRSPEYNREETMIKDVFRDQKVMNYRKNDQNDQSTTSERKKNIDIFNCRHNIESCETKMRRRRKKKFKFKKSWEVRAFVTSIVIAVQTILLTGPFISSFWIEIINGTILSMQTKFTLFFLFLANSLSNPIIYTWRIPEIRQEFRKLFNRNN